MESISVLTLVRVKLSVTGQRVTQWASMPIVFFAQGKTDVWTLAGGLNLNQFCGLFFTLFLFHCKSYRHSIFEIRFFPKSDFSTEEKIGFQILSYCEIYNGTIVW